MDTMNLRAEVLLMAREELWQLNTLAKNQELTQEQKNKAKDLESRIKLLTLTEGAR